MIIQLVESVLSKSSPHGMGNSIWYRPSGTIACDNI